MRGARTWLAWSFALVCLLRLARGAEADELPLSLATVASPNGGEATIAVPAAGCTYPLVFLRKADLSSINLYASPFFGAQGDSLIVNVMVPGNSKFVPAQTLENVPVSGQVLSIALSIPALPQSGSYQGTLIVTAPGKDAMVVKITLQRPTIGRPATLVADPQSLTTQVAQSPIFGWWPPVDASGATDFSVTLRDKDGTWPVEGIYPEIESILKAPNGRFSLGRNVTITFDGTSAGGDPAASTAVVPAPVGTLPGIPAQGHADALMHLQNLSTGEYDVTLRFRAANSADDDAQKVHLLIDVQAPLIFALAAIAAALVFSFVGTKIIAFKKKSLDLQQRIAALNSSWLKDEQPFVPVVCARAIINQCDELSRRFWLSGSDVIESRLTKVTALIGVLDQARQIRQGIEHLGQGFFVRTRAIATLERVIEGMGANCTDDKVLANTKTVLDGFADWSKPDHLEASYWAALSPWLTGLLQCVRLEAISVQADREFMKTLLDTLDSAVKNPPAGIEQKVEIERNFAFLKILWEQRGEQEEFNQLLTKIKGNADYEDVFKCAEDAAWKKVSDLAKAKKTRIVPPESGSSEAYAPITLRVTTGDLAVDNSVLFKHRLKFDWTIGRKEKSGLWRRLKERPALTPRTYQPEVVQYSAAAGTMTASVRILRGEETIEANPTALAIDPSGDFRLLRGFETTEMLSFVVASFIAIVTGIMAFYVKNPTFGSLQDYLSIGVWGLSADQTKNALQSYFGIAKS